VRAPDGQRSIVNPRHGGVVVAGEVAEPFVAEGDVTDLVLRDELPDGRRPLVASVDELARVPQRAFDAAPFADPLLDGEADVRRLVAAHEPEIR